MRHASPTNRRAAIIGAALFCASFTAAAAQSSLQQALLHSSLHPALRSSSQDTGVSEAAAPAPSTSVADALQQVATQAAVIFAGSVVSVTGDAGSASRVTFQVEQAIRGVASNGAYTMRLSAWAGGADRFVAGERALFLLTAPSALGYSAPVMGERGIVPLTGDSLVGNLDLRWIATDVQRAAPGEGSGAGPVMQSAAIATAEAPPAAGSIHAAQNTIPSPGPDSTPDVHSIDRDLILDLLRTGTAATSETR